jgi:hypothetical protein
MPYTEDRLRSIFDKTHGNCHICHGRLAFSNYGAQNAKGTAWEVEHSVPKALGGTDRLNNLYAAHVICNREKGTTSTRSARAQYGNTRAPHSKTKKEQMRDQNMLGAGAAGMVIGGLVGGPPGALIGATLFGALGRSAKIPK